MSRQEDFQKFDRLMKRALRLSKETVIGFINSLYGREYDPKCSTITYLNTEYPTEKNKEYADSMLTINGTDKFHMEIQIGDDNSMVFRMFEYEYRQARESVEHSLEKYELHFAEPKVIYLQHTGQTPDSMAIRLIFEGQGEFDYEVKTLKALEYTPEELGEQRLYMLIPFQLLATRSLQRKGLSQEREKRLLSEYDIRLESMVKVLDNEYGKHNISQEDYRELYLMIRDIQKYLYQDIPKVEEREVNQMVKEKTLLWSEQVRAEGEAEGEKRGRADFISMVKEYAQKNHCSIEEAFTTLEKIPPETNRSKTIRKAEGKSR